MEKGINILTEAMWLIICVTYQSTPPSMLMGSRGVCIYDEHMEMGEVNQTYSRLWYHDEWWGWGYNLYTYEHAIMSITACNGSDGDGDCGG